MIATSSMTVHQMEESGMRDIQVIQECSSTPPRKNQIKQTCEENPVEKEFSKDANLNMKCQDINVSSGESVKISQTQIDVGDENTEENDSSSSQCSCRMWTCSQCKKAFSSARALKIHEVKQHENMPKRYLECSQCDEVFEHGNLLQIHLKVHHKIKVRCPQCKDIFDHPKALSIHVKEHSSEPVCPVCGVKFDHDKLLKIHMEHYHKVSKKETAVLPTEQHEVQAFQPLNNLISSDSKRATESNDRQRVNGVSLSPTKSHPREATPSPGREDRGRELFHEVKVEEINSRHSSLSPHEVDAGNQESIRKEMVALRQGYGNIYHHRQLTPIHNRPMYYRPFNEKSRGPPPFGLMSFQPPGLRKRLEKRPLGRSHSLPLKQDRPYHEVPPGMPWPWTDANSMMYSTAHREKKIDRTFLEALRKSLKDKLRTVEATLLGEEEDPHHPLSSTLSEYYEQQGVMYNREDLPRPQRPSVITPRNEFDSYPFKRKASPSNLEPQEKIRYYEKNMDALQDSLGNPSASPSPKANPFSYVPGTELPPAFLDPVRPMYVRPFNSRDDLSILTRSDGYNISDQAKIFIKRGAPRCNRCQQTFSSKMEYLHHLISHRKEDGFADESREEMEFIEGVRRSLDLKNFGPFSMESQQRASSTTSSLGGSVLPEGEKVLERKEPQSVDHIDARGGGEDDSGDNDVDKAVKKTKTKASLADQPSPLSSQPEGDALSFGTATCSECKDVFADSMSCRMHIEKRHMKPLCRECGLTFDHKNLLKIHMDCYHSTLDVLQCYYCGMSFKLRSEFLDHVTSHEAQEIDKDKLGEHGAESAEPGGRRRWGRLVASAQLPSEKPEIENKERFLSNKDSLRSQETLLLKNHGKTKLRKAVSLSTYTDMMNRNRRSAADLLHDSRAKGDEVIGRETRTRIFLPNFEDRKSDDASRFDSSPSTEKMELLSPLTPTQKQSDDDAERLFLKWKALPNRGNKETHAFWSVERTPFTAQRTEEKRDPIESNHSTKEIETQRLQHTTTADEDMRSQRMPLLKRAFVRDEVETLYQLRHKKYLHSSEGKERDSPTAEPEDHRNALVKIERVELNPIVRQPKPVEQEHIDLQANYNSEQRSETVSSTEHHRNAPEQNNTAALAGVSPKRYPDETTVSSVALPPPLIDIRRIQQNSSPILSVCCSVSTDCSPTSNGSNSHVTLAKSNGCKVKENIETEPNTSPVEETGSTVREVKGKRRNSIKKLTKEALINSLSLKRRASAPDLHQMQRDPTEDTSAEKPQSPMIASPRSPSDGRDSPVERSNTKHHGLRSQQYTPRRQSDRDVTCKECGVSFGHKKLYKIHLDSYHGKPQLKHECLQCGSKNFRDKDEFLKHLMAHQTESKNKGEESVDPCDATASGREESQDDRQTNSIEMTDEQLEIEPKAKVARIDTTQDYEKSKFILEEFAPYVPQVLINNTLKIENDLSDESERHTPRVNNNAKEMKEKETTCFTCGKSFENGKQLEQHFSSHARISEDGRFRCVCGKAFETHRKLEIHSRSHTGFKPHKCEQCGRCFPYYSSYYYHKMTHIKDRPHKCPLCGKGFIQTRYLRSHLRTHKDEQGTLSDEVESIIQKVELNMNEDTDEESIDSPGTAEGFPACRTNDEEAETAEILCSFKRVLNSSAQNSDAESPVVPNNFSSD